MSGAGGPIPRVPGAANSGRSSGFAVVVGSHEPEGWRVAVMRGAEPPILLSSEEARRIGRDLIGMADVCEGRWGE